MEGLGEEGTGMGVTDNRKVGKGKGMSALEIDVRAVSGTYLHFISVHATMFG